VDRRKENSPGWDSLSLGIQGNGKGRCRERSISGERGAECANYGNQSSGVQCAAGEKKSPSTKGRDMSSGDPCKRFERAQGPSTPQNNLQANCSSSLRMTGFMYLFRMTS